MTALFEPAPLESARFGLVVARGSLAAAPDPQELRAAVLQARLDLLVLRIDAGDGRQSSRLAQSGLPCLHADTLVTWSCPLQQIEPAALRHQQLDLRTASAADGLQLDTLMDGVFSAYANHYTANPLLSAAAALAGYREWARSHIDQPDRLCWLSHEDGVVTGMACSRHDSATGIAVGVLHGIAPGHGRRGVYTDLIRATQWHYRKAGFQRLDISTQAANLAVQRVWAREGFRPERTEHTWHLQPMLAHTLAQPAVRHEPGLALTQLLPTGVGESRVFSGQPIHQVHQACWQTDQHNLHCVAAVDAAGAVVALAWQQCVAAS